MDPCFSTGRFRSGVRSLLPVGYKVQFRQKAARFFIVALTVAAPYEAVNEFTTRGNWFLPLAFQFIHSFHERRFSLESTKIPAVIEGVNELQGRVFPSSERRGGCAIKKMLRSLLMKAQTGML